MAVSSLSSTGAMAVLDSRGGICLGSLPPRAGLGSSFCPTFKDVTDVTTKTAASDDRYVLLINAIGASIEAPGPFDGISRKFARFMEDSHKLAPIGKAVAGIGAAVAGVGLGGQVLQTLDTLPIIPQMELVVGTLVTANFALQYLRGGEGRARLEDFFQDLRERVIGKKETLPSEPLELKLVEVLDENLHPQLSEGGKGQEEMAIVADRQAFMAALKTFIDKREMKARQVTKVLEEDMAVLATTVMKERARTEELETILRKQRSKASKLGELNDSLVVEKSKTFNEMIKLQTQMQGLEMEVNSLRGERFRLENVKNELEARVFSGVEERERLGMQITPFVEQRTKEVDSKAAVLASQVEALSKEKKERESRVRWLEQQMERTREFAMEVSSSVEELASEKKEREAHIGWLESCLTKSETKTVETENKLTALQAQLQNILKDSEEKKETFKHEVASLKSSLKQAEVRVQAAELKATQAVRASQFAQAQVAAIAAELNNKAVRVEAKRGQPLKLVEVTSDMVDGGGMNERELEAYASLVKTGYLDIGRPSREQLNGVEALVQVLVKKGAPEGWARRHVLNTHAYDRRKAIAWGRGASLGEVFTRVLG